MYLERLREDLGLGLQDSLGAQDGMAIKDVTVISSATTLGQPETCAGTPKIGRTCCLRVF